MGGGVAVEVGWGGQVRAFGVPEVAFRVGAEELAGVGDEGGGVEEDGG